jgi:hypothetical protein
MNIIDTFPAFTSQLSTLSTKPIFSLNTATRSALSIELVDNETTPSPMQYTSIICTPDTLTIPVIDNISINKSQSDKLYPTRQLISMYTSDINSIFLDISKTSRKIYSPIELFNRYDNTITGTKSEFLQRTKLKSYVNISILVPKTVNDVKLIMTRENLTTDIFTRRLKLIAAKHIC